MPRLSCWSCGRQIYTVAPLEALFLEERRCPRCGAFLNSDRRDVERRIEHRRKNPTHDPGPPGPKRALKPKMASKATDKVVPKAADKAARKAKDETAEEAERRLLERRTRRRRGKATS